MAVKTTPTRFNVEVPPDAWGERSARLPLRLELWSVGGWHLLNSLGQVVEITSAGALAQPGPWSPGTGWPSYAEATEALERHLAAGGKLP